MFPISQHLRVFFRWNAWLFQENLSHFRHQEAKIYEKAKNCHNMAKTWPWYGTKKSALKRIFFVAYMSLQWSITGIQKQRYFRNSPKMALIWPKHGQNMIPIRVNWWVFFYLACKNLQWKFEPFQASTSKDMVEIAKAWPKHGPNIVPISQT